MLKVCSNLPLKVLWGPMLRFPLRVGSIIGLPLKESLYNALQGTPNSTLKGTQPLPSKEALYHCQRKPSNALMKEPLEDPCKGTL